MANHVDYNTDKRIIYVTTAPTLEGGDWVVNLDVKIDLYSDSKEDWLTNDALNKFEFPIRSVGGDDLPGEKSLGATFFLDSGWKLRPYEGDHVFKVDGNFYSEDGTSPFVTTSGVYNIMIINTVSSLVDSIVQQQTEIEYASFAGAIHIDVINGVAGTDYPTGTPQLPVNNLTDAQLIANERGFSTLHIIGDITFQSGTNLDRYEICGEGHSLTHVTFVATSSSYNTILRNCTIAGSLNNSDMHVYTTHVENLDGFSGSIIDSLLMGTITLSGTENSFIINCIDGFAGFGLPIINFGGSGRGVNIRGYQGGLRLENKSGPEDVSIGLNAGRLEIASDVTAGQIIVRGVGQISENSGSADVFDSGLVNAQITADNVWDEDTAGHTEQGTFGAELATKADLAASTSTDLTPAFSGIIVEGSNVTGDYTSTFTRDNTYWQIAEDGTTGITLEFTFYIPEDHKPGVFSLFGRYTGQPAINHHQELWIYNYESVSWELLNNEFILGGNTSDMLYKHEYYERHIDRANSNEVKIRTIHHVTTYNNSHRFYIDYMDISSIEVTTAADIADAVWADPQGILVASGVESIREIEKGRWKIESNQMIFYEEDNTTEIMRFDLFDEAGNPANTDIFDRRRV